MPAFIRAIKEESDSENFIKALKAVNIAVTASHASESALGSLNGYK